MRLMLKPEWRIWPLSSFLGRLDLKTGVTVSLMFALLNKVAGVYGLIAVVMGAGGSFAQLSLYLYSVITLGGLIWGLRIAREEDAKRMLYFADLFFADHVLSTVWTVFFVVVWWVYTPHDGRRTANSAAQEQIAQDGAGGGPNTNMTEAQRTAAAHLMWDTEKGMAAAVISLSWLTKIYFAMLIYSYAVHLRKGSYCSLPSTRFAEAAAASAAPAYENSALPDDEDELDDFYRVPLRSPDAAMRGEEGPRGDVIAEMDGGQSKLFGECYRGAHCAANEHARDIAAAKECVVDCSDATPTTEDEI
ncbi:DUF1753-domain-containing protein [Athelia psychrophila]|uniref:DUF1753-domain-containing protein n=1 Tax=Athelia psychrophila TaxID=1759441 RepID=A0A167VXT6_9AGAM|nr:DUF1753-domain-containing protein [Fibularhizoctonia sp. CBS 109695]